MRCLFLLPFIAIVALHLLLFHMEGPIHLPPMMPRMHRRYILPHHYRRENKHDPTPHNYHMWRSCLLLLYVTLFFSTPTAPNTGVQTPYYNTLPQRTSVTSPHNTRYNSKWVLQCGNVHPIAGHRRIYQLR